MPRPAVLTQEQIQSQLKSLPTWQLLSNKLHRELKFKSFADAFAFMTRAAQISEQLDHHPEWSNVYNRVTIDLTTHDCGGISELDFEWAKRVEAALNKETLK